MKSRALALSLCLGSGLLLCPLARGAVVFKPGDKVKYVTPGEEQMNGNAEELFHIGQTAEANHDTKRAIKAYKTLVRKHPKDALAPGALYRIAELTEQSNDLLTAATLFRTLVERYPSSPHFDEAIEAQFRIGEAYLGGKKLKMLGIPFATSMDKAVEVFAAVIRTAPYGKYTARAQFNIGLAREKQHINDAALSAYQAVIDKFPNDPLASDAQYQIGYIWLLASKAGTRDLAATKKARLAFQDFLFRYPNSEKAAQARSNMELLENKQTSSAYDVAKFYDKQKHYRAAVIYYNEVIREQPGSPQSEQAQKRINELRAKLGDSIAEIPTDAEKNKTAASPDKTKNGAPAASTTTNGGLLPPPETDLSLPPPTSLAPDKTTAPPDSTESESHGSPTESPTPSPAESSTPEASTSPEEIASPTP